MNEQPSVGTIDMRFFRFEWTPRMLMGLFGAVLYCGCQTPETQVDESQVQRYEERMSGEGSFQPAAELSRIDAPAPSELSGEIASTQPSVDAAVWLHLPDPVKAEEVMNKRLATARMSENIISEYRDNIYKNSREFMHQIDRPRKIELSLVDALRRALANNYQILVEGYAPAISTAQVVQAEAAFDAAFFFNASRDNTDRPQPFLRKTPLQQRAFETDTTIVAGGIRKVLATGANVTFSQQMTRVANPSSVYTQYYPLYSQNFVAEIRQPLLKNFGMDFNRAQINIRKNERVINEEVFRAKVIEILNTTEQGYWNLVAARRDVAISAELLAQAALTLRQIEARSDFDAYQTLLFRSQANLKQREFEYISVKNRVRDAEDQLVNLMNDPGIPLTDESEIVPVDNPSVAEILLDRYESVQRALEHRPEIIQARHAVDIARLQIGIAKNQALPQLDVIYRMTMNGLGQTADRGFDQMSGANFIDQFVGMEFLWFFGERGERAGIRIAALQQSQAVARYKRALDDIITDCRVTMRKLETSFEQIGPSYEGVLAASENLRSLQERQERKSPAELDTVLNAQGQLAQARRSLLQAIVAYNQGIVDVERAKGTLLEYNNVILSEQP